MKKQLNGCRRSRLLWERIFPLHLPSYSCIPDALVTLASQQPGLRTYLCIPLSGLPVFIGTGIWFMKNVTAFTSVSDMLKNEKKIKSVVIIAGISLVMLVFAVLLMAYYGYKLTQSSGTIHGPIFRPLSVDLHGPVFLQSVGVTSTIYLIAQIIEREKSVLL